MLCSCLASFAPCGRRPCRRTYVGPSGRTDPHPQFGEDHHDVAVGCSLLACLIRSASCADAA
eukprot:15445504-Alexandrium_andersonii.AAC.1